MPYEESVAVILESLPQGSDLRIEGLFRLLAQTKGKPGSIDVVARRLGFGSRFALARGVKKLGLPSVSQLCGWFQIMDWVQRWQMEGLSLCRQAMLAGQDPAVNYRKTKGVTGKTWTEVRSAGLRGVVAELQNRLFPPPRKQLPLIGFHKLATYLDGPDGHYPVVLLMSA